MPSFFRRFVGALLLLFALTIAGLLGYMIIEGWSAWDALYMSAITLTAVGYQEVHPLSQAGRHFTMFLLLGGFTWMGVWFAIITSFIIERDSDRVEQFYSLAPDAHVIQGDATADHNLEDAGIARAQGLVASLSADTDNLFVCLSARDLNPDLVIVARAYEEETMSKMYRAGADHVVSPNVSSAIRMASVMLRPSVLSFLDVATRSPDFSLRVEEAPIDESSRLAGQRLKEARIPEKTGLIVIAVRTAETDDGRFVFNLVAETRLEPGDVLIVLGDGDQIEKLQAYVRS